MADRRGLGVLCFSHKPLGKRHAGIRGGVDYHKPLFNLFFLSFWSVFHPDLIRSFQRLLLGFITREWHSVIWHPHFYYPGLFALDCKASEIRSEFGVFGSNAAGLSFGFRWSLSLHHNNIVLYERKLSSDLISTRKNKYNAP